MNFDLTSVDAQWIFAFLAVGFSCVAFLPYMRDTWAGRTEPRRSAWLIWSVLSVVSLAAQVAEGATSSLAFAAVQSGGTVIIFVLSIRKGTGSFVQGADGWVILAAACGVSLWMITDNAVYALGISITISLLGGLLATIKANASPDTETISTWAISFLAAICALGSVGTLDWVLLAYPVYLLTLYGAILIAIWSGRRREERNRVDPFSTILQQRSGGI